MRYSVLGLVVAVACGNSSHPSSFDANSNASDAQIDAPIAIGWSHVSVGDQFACGIRNDQGLWCWGDNVNGELGQGLAAGAQLGPTRVGIASWIAVASSPLSTCAIQTDHSLWCWGTQFTALGYPQPPMTDTSTPVQLPGLWSAVSLQEFFGCGLQTDNTVWCWSQWPRPDNTFPQSESPQQIDTSPTAMITTGLSAICTIRMDGTLWCRGIEHRGELGDDIYQPPQLAPIQVVGNDTWKSVSGGLYATCGVTTAGQLRCWGRPVGTSNAAMQSVFVPTPVLVGGEDLSDWVQVQLSVSADNACATRSDGSLWCWGKNDRNQSGHASDLVITEPTVVGGGAVAWSTSASSLGTTCALGNDHSLWCVGSNGRGQLGNAGASRTSPVVVPGTYAQVANPGVTTCLLDQSGSASCAGNGREGEIGDGNSRDRRTFVAVAQASAWTAIYGGDENACGLAAGGSLWCWGTYPGTGAIVDPMPAHVTGTWKSIAVNLHTCAIDSTDHVSCWGSDGYGETGCIAHDPSDPPAPIGGSATWSAIATSNDHTCGISSAGTMCWGANFWGQLGDGDTDPKCMPTLVSGGLTFKKLAAGTYHTCGIAADDHVYCWGHNYDSQLGNGASADSTSPVMIATPLFRSLAAGFGHTCGIATDGSLWCWGNNSYGQLGDGTQLNHSTPTRVGSDVDWADISAGDYVTCATKIDHTAWCWGSNDYGQLGDNQGWVDELVQVP